MIKVAVRVGRINVVVDGSIMAVQCTVKYGVTGLVLTNRRRDLMPVRSFRECLLDSIAKDHRGNGCYQSQHQLKLCAGLFPLPQSGVVTNSILEPLSHHVRCMICMLG